MNEETPTLLVNRIRTPDGTILESKHRHDYITYKDRNGHTYMADGGTSYLRRNVINEAPYEELSLYSTDDFEEIRKYFKRGGRGIDGKQPLTYVPLKDMNSPWIWATIEYIGGEEYCLNPDNAMANLYVKELKYRGEWN